MARADLLREIERDLRGEYVDFDRLLAGLDEQELAAATPAAGWSVADGVGHLAYFEDLAVLAMTDAPRFEAHVGALTDPEDDIRKHLARSRALPPAAVVGWWREGSERLLAVASGLDPSDRIPWFGPAPMSAASFLTARLMETWAHGQDVVDALGIEREPTARLRHVAHLGVAAMPFSYLARGRGMPGGSVHVGLDAPDGSRWEWGDPAAGDRVEGEALDFCLVVTQRRHPHDTALRIVGPEAGEWMAIAQAFAGPPGAGREPGQFPQPPR